MAPIDSTESNLTPPTTQDQSGQVLMGVGALLVAAVLAYGAVDIPSSIGYSGVGTQFSAVVGGSGHDGLRRLVAVGGLFRRISPLGDTVRCRAR